MTHTRWIIALAIVLALVLGAAWGAGYAFSRQLIYYPTPTIVAPEMEGVSAVRIATEDGESLVAWWRPPPPGAPVILYFDGNGGRPEIWTTRWQHIEDGGAGFLAVYYRGYSGSTGSPSEAGLRIDARAGYDWLIAQGYRAQDIVIHGYSLGSGVAVGLAAERPARALLLEAPFTGVDDVAASEYGPLARLVVRDPFRSRDFITRVHMPVLVIHGDADAVIPFAQGERLYAMANEPKHFVRIAGGTHNDLIDNGLYNELWSFLAQHPAE